MLAVTASVDLLLADGRLMVAGPAAAQPVAQRSVDLAGRIGLSELAGVALTLVATAEACRGETAAMQSTLQEALSASQSPAVAALVDFARAFQPLLADDLPGARDLLDAAMERRSVGAPLAHWGLWVLVRTVLGDCDLQVREALRTSPAINRVVNGAALRFAEAVAAGREGDTVRAMHCFTEADQMLSTQHWWRRLLRLLALRGAVENHWGQPIPELRADLAEFEAAGENQLARTARDLLRRAGVTVRRGRGGSPVPAQMGGLGVTSREVDVLTLVTSGLTNAEIATRLFLSVRTVDHHVASLLAKTGTANRAELSAAAGRK
jgi:DNA-binding CsgD family transcriptional regulator